MEMEFGNGTSDDHEAASSIYLRNRRNGQTNYHRHTPEQIQHLESFFKNHPHPDLNQRQQLSQELGLEPKQIKFWFQNKRTQTKTQNERADNNVLRQENEQIHCENLFMAEKMKNLMCPNCDDSYVGEEVAKQKVMEQLQLENQKLRAEHARVTAIMEEAIKDQMAILRQGHLSMASHSPAGSLVSDNEGNGSGPVVIQETNKLLTVEMVSNGLQELIELLRVDEPLWVKTSCDDSQGRSFVILGENYDKFFPRPRRVMSSAARFESSKDSLVLPMKGSDLMELLMHPTNWMSLFPTLVPKAQTVGIIDCTEHLGGPSHLMYMQMHVLSPLVPVRDFLILRHCHQLDVNSWVIVDVSYDFAKEKQEVGSRCWKLPSGCMIRNLPNGMCKVTWVEHVEVDDLNMTNRLFRDKARGSQFFGATVWLAALQRSCERLAFSKGLSASQAHELEGVISSIESRTSVMQLANKMVKNFFAMLSMLNRVDSPKLPQMPNTVFRMAVRASAEPSRPMGRVISSAAVFWLPVPLITLFNFLKNENTRVQWDVLSNGIPINEIAHITCGSHHANDISILRPFVSHQDVTLVLQESWIDPLGAHIIYAPTEIQTITTAISGQDTTNCFILPSGITMCSSHESRQVHEQIGSASNQQQQSVAGSLVTIAFQAFVSCDVATSLSDQNESVTAVNNIIAATVKNIRAVFDVAGSN